MKTAIVLSGGGAKGAYQVGFYRAIRHLRIKYDIVTGTSVGALNGVFLVEKNYRKLYKVWNNISYKDVFGFDIPSNIERLDLLKTYTKAFIISGGMDTTSLENLFIEKMNLKKIKKSKIDYGLATFNLTDFKPVYKTKKNLIKDDFVNFVIASASIYPAFKTKKIKNKEYIDGGYFDQIPVTLALKMGAERLIVVDLKAPGIVMPVNTDKEIINIVNNHNFGNILEFDKNISKVLISYGYYDTLKKFNKLDGKNYTFKKNDLLNNYNKYYLKVKDIIVNIFNKSKKDPNKLYNIIDGKNFNKILNNAIEVLGKDFNIIDYKLYSIKKYNKLIKQKFDIKEKYDILDVKFKYKKIFECIDNKDYIKLKRMSIIYNKQFIPAIYLYVICNN